MRILKRMSLTFLLILISIFVFSINIQAISDDSGSATYQVVSNVRKFDTLYSHYVTDSGLTTYGGTNYSQQVHVFTQAQTENSKICTWAKKDDSGKIMRTPVAAIAADYESTHPDFEVLGAINADQYTTGFGTDIPSQGRDYYYPQPYYPMICDGEGWFIMTGIPVSGSQNICGIFNDGRTDSLISGQANILSGNISISGMYLYILDENDNRLQRFEVNKFNETPRETETTLWTSFYNSNQEFPEITVSGEHVYAVDEALRAYASNSIDYTYKGNNAQNAFFGKGYISRTGNSLEIGYGDFALSTKNEDVINALEVGSKILVQYELDGDFSNCPSGIGFHTIQRMNGNDGTISSSNAYNTRQYPRAIIGQKENGDIVLMCIDGSQAASGYCGANYWEINAMLKNYGVTEAYQMDGGGSATAVIKDETGQFRVVNSPSDGSARSIFSALLMVERRKPEGVLNVLSLTQTGVNLNCNIDSHGRNITKVTLEINNQQIDITNLKNVTLNLTHNNSYDYKLIIEENNATTYEVTNTLELSLMAPTLNQCLLSVTDDEFIFDIDFNDFDSVLDSYYFMIDGERYYPTDNKIKVKKTNNVVYLTYSYTINGQEYTETIVFPYSEILRKNEEMYLFIYNKLLREYIFR